MNEEQISPTNAMESVDTFSTDCGICDTKEPEISELCALERCEAGVVPSAGESVTEEILEGIKGGFERKEAVGGREVPNGLGMDPVTLCPTVEPEPVGIGSIAGALAKRWAWPIAALNGSQYRWRNCGVHSRSSRVP